MNIKTSELTDIALDWAVSAAKGLSWKLHGHIPFSTDWAQGGPIIERERISFVSPNEVIDEWEAIHPTQMHNESYGPTPLIAAMRCYVASKLGDEVDVPDELNQGVKK